MKQQPRAAFIAVNKKSKRDPGFALLEVVV
jgi:hypothetical protein